MEKTIKRTANALMMLLELCEDADLVDEVCERVSGNVPFDDVDFDEVDNE